MRKNWFACVLCRLETLTEQDKESIPFVSDTEAIDKNQMIDALRRDLYESERQVDWIFPPRDMTVDAVKKSSLNPGAVGDNTVFNLCGFILALSKQPYLCEATGTDRMLLTREDWKQQQKELHQRYTDMGFDVFYHLRDRKKEGKENEDEELAQSEVEAGHATPTYLRDKTGWWYKTSKVITTPEREKALRRPPTAPNLLFRGKFRRPKKIKRSTSAPGNLNVLRNAKKRESSQPMKEDNLASKRASLPDLQPSRKRQPKRPSLPARLQPLSVSQRGSQTSSAAMASESVPEEPEGADSQSNLPSATSGGGGQHQEKQAQEESRPVCTRSGSWPVLGTSQPTTATTQRRSSLPPRRYIRGRTVLAKPPQAAAKDPADFYQLAYGEKSTGVLLRQGSFPQNAPLSFSKQSRSSLPATLTKATLTQQVHPEPLRPQTAGQERGSLPRLVDREFAHPPELPQRIFSEALQQRQRASLPTPGVAQARPIHRRLSAEELAMSSSIYHDFRQPGAREGLPLESPTQPEDPPLSQIQPDDLPRQRRLSEPVTSHGAVHRPSSVQSAPGSIEHMDRPSAGELDMESASQQAQDADILRPMLEQLSIDEQFTTQGLVGELVEPHRIDEKASVPPKGTPLDVSQQHLESDQQHLLDRRRASLPASSRSAEVNPVRRQSDPTSGMRREHALRQSALHRDYPEEGP